MGWLVLKQAAGFKINQVLNQVQHNLYADILTTHSCSIAACIFMTSLVMKDDHIAIYAPTHLMLKVSTSVRENWL